MSKDNLSLELSVVFFYKINNPTACWGDPGGWISTLVQAALFASAGERDFQTILSEPEQFNQRLMEIVSSRLGGADAAVAISAVSLLSVKIEAEMVNAMAKVAIAERERRAKIISADADFKSAPRLVEAARIMSAQPGTMGLRQLSTMLQIGREQNTTLIFPFAYEMLNGSTADERSDEKEQPNNNDKGRHASPNS